MKKIRFFILFIFSILILSSCNKKPTEDDDHPIIATKLSDVFRNKERKDYAFKEYNPNNYLDFNINDDISYSVKFDNFRDIRNSKFNLKLKYKGNEYLFDSIKGYFSNLKYINNTLVLVVYHTSSDFMDENTLEVATFDENKNTFVSRYFAHSCTYGFNDIYFYNGFYYLYYYNTSSTYFSYAKLSFDNEVTKETKDNSNLNVIDAQNIMRCADVVKMSFISPFEFYFVSHITLYYCKDNGDNKLIQGDDIYFVTNDADYIYEKGNNVEFYEIKATQILSACSCKVYKFNIEKEDNDNTVVFDSKKISKEKIFNEDYFLRELKYYTYNNKVYFVLKSIFGFYEYDFDTKKLSYYLDARIELLNTIQIKNKLLFEIKKDNNISVLELDMI